MRSCSPVRVLRCVRVLLFVFSYVSFVLLNAAFVFSKRGTGRFTSAAATSLDALLDSGLYTGELTELSGGPGSGKSQSAVFIDTTGGLGAGRLLQMLRAETSSEEEQRIQVFRVFDVFALLDCLYGLRAGRLQQVGDAQ
ncbi:DNA repair protein RAD51 4 [Liparis tanakae]|uniref:DNA repair protein RAD51 4 n=1 Tax=Liparis tanakae TaxID=230148 RepID=A0A4Z2FGJ6_9TELE|nr:DNA repair protein RAD51 4 [Liparis tanakae]